jgi:hypothetical protein
MAAMPQSNLRRFFDSGAGPFTWADAPALLLAGVSAVTVTAGAQLLRGQGTLLMLALGIGVAGATFVLDKLLVERFNAIRPRQSLWALLLCWAPFFLLSTAMATVATFSWIAPDVARRDLEQGRRAHWTAEAGKYSDYVMRLTSAARKQAADTQLEIDAERRRIAAARREGTSAPPDALRALQRRLAAARELDRRLPAIELLPPELPAHAPAAQAQVQRVARELGDVHASALLVLAAPPPLPAYAPFAPPPVDLQSVLAEETKNRSWRAATAWGAALWVELLPMLALWRGGRKIPLATRIQHWRHSAGEVGEALIGRRAATPLPILIEPLHVRGVVRVSLPSEYTLTDCSPLLEEAVRSLTDVLGSYQLNRVSNARGQVLDEHVPLLPQLAGEPLVLSVVEGRS